MIFHREFEILMATKDEFFPLHFFILALQPSLSRGKSVEDEKYHQLKDPLIFHLASILHVPKKQIFIQR
jgi:hypothetical protein